MQMAAVEDKRRWLGDRQSGRLVQDTREDPFNPSLEMWVWTQLEVGSRDTDLDTSHVEVTADTAGTDDLSE